MKVEIVLSDGTKELYDDVKSAFVKNNVYHLLFFKAKCVKIPIDRIQRIVEEHMIPATKTTSFPLREGRTNDSNG